LHVVTYIHILLAIFSPKENIYKKNLIKKLYVSISGYIQQQLRERLTYFRQGWKDYQFQEIAQQNNGSVAWGRNTLHYIFKAKKDFILKGFIKKSHIQ